MAFKRKTPAKILEDLKKRLSAVEQIDLSQGKTINYGDEKDPLTKTEIKAQVTEYENLVAKYNQMLQEADKLGNQFREAEKKMKETHTRILAGAISKFGRDANEIEQLGAIRKSERKKPTKKDKPN
jgi:hypothetical protein